MDRESMFSRILIVIGLIAVISIAVSLFSTIIWFAFTILFPIAIIVWLVRAISGRSNRNRYR